jgi:hypothetical protein
MRQYRSILPVRPCRARGLELQALDYVKRGDVPREGA